MFKSTPRELFVDLQGCLTLFWHHGRPLICLTRRISCQLMKNILTTVKADLSCFAQMDWETKSCENLGIEKRPKWIRAAFSLWVLLIKSPVYKLEMQVAFNPQRQFKHMCDFQICSRTFTECFGVWALEKVKVKAGQVPALEAGAVHSAGFLVLFGRGQSVMWPHCYW